MLKNEFYAGSPNTDRSSPISDYLYPLFDFVCRGYELGYELCLLGAKRCTLRQTQGDKKVPQIIEFVGLVCLLSGIVRLVQRRGRLSNLYFHRIS